ncbi:hypothetical protein TNCV_557071 [Trichonephila clavipes]|uniref:Uncharacterized protein n=1 Tax=Trichonephila clavipes TaxID=2585209 RepID=A0A8X6V6Y9_TRICX|nr:hypothetical protein TNCV_557071 [Trichonephila clavipes]
MLGCLGKGGFKILPGAVERSGSIAKCDIWLCRFAFRRKLINHLGLLYGYLKGSCCSLDKSAGAGKTFIALPTRLSGLGITYACGIAVCRSVCQLSGVPNVPHGRLVPIPSAIAPFHRIGIDLLGNFKVCSKQMDNSARITQHDINKSLADSRSRRNSEVLT